MGQCKHRYFAGSFPCVAWRNSGATPPDSAQILLKGSNRSQASLGLPRDRREGKTPNAGFNIARNYPDKWLPI